MPALNAYRVVHHDRMTHDRDGSKFCARLCLTLYRLSCRLAYASVSGNYLIKNPCDLIQHPPVQKLDESRHPVRFVAERAATWRCLLLRQLPRAMVRRSGGGKRHRASGDAWMRP